MKKHEHEAELVKLTVRLPESLVERAKIRAVKEKTTLQEMVGAALEGYLKTPKGRERSRGDE